MDCGTSAPENLEHQAPGAAVNRLLPQDRMAHDWYRFVLSFPSHLVRDYVQRFGMEKGCRILDPFCGTGTTLVECKKLGIESVGIEANPMARFAAQVKVDWSPDPDGLLRHSRLVADAAMAELRSQVHTSYLADVTFEGI
jgi:hypothetical protein